METHWADQAVRFLSFRDPVVRYAVVGSGLLGISCGLLGSFIVVRRLSLVGDTLSHAVLPGVALGFLWNMTKDPLAIFLGATAAGLLGSVTVNLITQTTRLKEDSALGMVLASFFAVGICLLTMIQNLPTGNKSGIDKYLFGQAAALSGQDIALLGGVTILAITIISFCYKEFLVTSFDPEFARAIGFPASAMHYLLMLLLAFAVVISLQAVGVVLVSAMLITPAAAAYLLTDRLHRMVILAASFGLLAGLSGCFLSFLGNNLPTGPFMVLSATGVFVAAFLAGPRHGLMPRLWREHSRVARVRRENTLKWIYHDLEDREFADEGVSLEALAARCTETIEWMTSCITDLGRHDLVTRGRDQIYLTPAGWRAACAVVRNHRLWELYLTHAANIAPDHVHDDAEKIEHILGEKMVRQLERQLNYETLDPHGRQIPTLEDIEAGQPYRGSQRSGSGYTGNRA